MKNEKCISSCLLFSVACLLFIQVSRSINAEDNNSSYKFDKKPAAHISGKQTFEWAGQCPIRQRKDFTPANELTSGSVNGAISQQQFANTVQVEARTGRRTFNGRIVGIFSCHENSDFIGNDLTLDFRLAKPVVDLAVRAVNLKYTNMHFNVSYRTAPDICRHQQAAGHAADEFYVNGANFFVGPGCSESLASVGQLASYWNVPMCSTGYLPEVVTARFNPLTLMQLSLSVQSVGEMLLELFQMYKWRHLVIVTDTKHPLHSQIRDGLLEFFHTMYKVASSSRGANNPTTTPRPHYHNRSPTATPYYINITSRNFAYNKQTGNNNNNNNNHASTGTNKAGNTGSSNSGVDYYEQVMLDAATCSRVMLLLARSSTIASLLEAAHNQGMSKNGQFVFIAHELFETQMFDSGEGAENIGPALQAGIQAPANKHLKFSIDDKIEPVQSMRDQELTRETFQPLMTISMRIPTTQEFDTFRAEVASLTEREFNYRVQPTSIKSLYSLAAAALIYDCVMLYADKVDFVLSNTHFMRIDGSTIFELSAGKTFRGSLTGDLTINRAGQRVIDFTLNDFSPKTLQLEPIAHFMALERRLNFLPGKQPHWTLKNQSAPKSDPRCRLNDLFCRYIDELTDPSDLAAVAAGTIGVAGARNYPDRVVLGVWLLVIIVISVTLTSSIIGWLVYRRFRIESELLNLWWSIKYEDILFEDEMLCDGKRSMSSLAISNESFNAAAGGAVATSSNPSGGGGSPKEARPSQQQQQQSSQVPPQVTTTDISSSTNNINNNNTNNINSKQLSVCHSLGQDGQTVLSSAQSTSTLSVTAPSLAGSTSSLAGNVGVNVTHAAHSAPTNSRSAIMMQNLNSGASKLIPLITNTQAGGRGNPNSLQSAGAVKNRLKKSHLNSNSKNVVGKFNCVSSSQLGACAKVGLKGPTAASAGLSAGGVGGVGGCATVKDPSISSQNKNVKLRLGTVLNGGRGERNTTKVGMYKASRVAAKHLNVRNLNINRQLLIELRQVRDLTHENLIKFIGLCPEEPNVAIVSELCTRGNLQDLLQNETIRLDWPFRYSIINDIVDGLIHLHSSPIQFHGRLKSSNCVIDNRFVVKLTDFGLPTLLAAVEMNDDEQVNPRLLLWTAPEHLRTKHPLLSGSQKGDIYGLAIIFQEIITRCGPFECEPILCGASEVGAPLDWHSSGAAAASSAVVAVTQATPLIRTTDAVGRPLGGVQGRRATSGNPTRINAPGSYASGHQHQQQQQFIAGPASIMGMGVTAPALFQPVVVQHKQRLEPEEIVNLVRMGLSPPFRPYFRPDVAAPTPCVPANSSGANAQHEQSFNVADLIAIVQSCWQEAPAMRPTVASVKQQIKKMRRGCHLDGTNLMDNLLQRMERYTDNLESLVEQKTAELMEEKKRSEELLYEMLPRFVVDQLKYGHSVTPEAYEAVTISFSDIKDFTSIAAQSSPIDVVNLLNQLYTEFDECIARYDVYKVETIGDAYMVVSGLPVRNGDQHAREIAEMSLGLLELISNFDVIHLPHLKLELRIGIHSGPCASGVVGTRMFRYCLFGDTVNTASRMESHGEPMKIHTSEDSAIILKKFNTFVIEPRGEIDIKGKGLMKTYWLTGKINEVTNHTNTTRYTNHNNDENYN